MGEHQPTRGKSLMLLYFKTGACSLATRIVLLELGLPFDTVKVDTDAGTTEHGSDYSVVNPKGYVPALEVTPGTVITENLAILQYLADQAPEAGLAPPAGTLDRVRLQEWLSFTSSELLKAFSPWFGPQPLNEEEKARAEKSLYRRLGDVERALYDGRTFLVGNAFTVADAYLFVVLSWSASLGLDLGGWPKVASYVARVAARPAVRAARRAEGLLHGEAAE